MNWLRTALGSWRTTVVGVLATLAVLFKGVVADLDDDPATQVDWFSTLITVLMGWGFIEARDNKVSSEKAGAK